MKTKPIPIEDRILILFEGNLKRIFAMKITRSTFRELQNMILTCSGHNKDIANFLFETLLIGEVASGWLNERETRRMEEVINHFTIPARLAKDVHERGEFINVITSDMISQQDDSALLNRIRRIDGEEFVFLSNAENTMHLIQHFIARLQELQSNKKVQDDLAKYKKELNLASERLKQLAAV